MRKVISFIVLLVILLSINLVALAENNNETLLEVQADNFQFYNQNEREQDGVRSFFVDEKTNNVYILDTFNDRIQVFNKNQLVKTIKLPQNREFTSLYIDKNDIYLLDTQKDIFSEAEIFKINKNGDKIEKLIVPLNIDNSLQIRLPDGTKTFYNPIKTILNVRDNIISLQYANGRVFTYDIKTNSFKEKQIEFKEDKKDNTKISNESPLFTNDKEIKYLIRYEEQKNGKKLYANRVIRKIDINGNVNGVAKLIEDDRDYRKNDIQVTNKNVYQLVTNENTVKVIKLNLSNNYSLNEIKPISNNNTNTGTNSFENTSISTKSTSTVTPSIAYDNAFEYESLYWNYNEAENGLQVSYTELPDYLSDIQGEETVKGVPYCWGGYQSRQGFEISIFDGWQAGNVKCTGGYKNGTAGVDCSGFVSQVYEIGYKLSTSTMHYEFTTIDKSDIGYMDILNRPGVHVLIYLGSDSDGVYSIESTISGEDKVHCEYRTWYSLRYYDAMRLDEWM